MSTLNETQLLYCDKTGSTFADPLDPDYTVRFKTNKTVKRVDGVSLDNYRSEIIINDLYPVTAGSSTVKDTISIRISVSGSDLSRDRQDEILNQLCAQVPTWSGENVFLGFRPVTVPSNPVE